MKRIIKRIEKSRIYQFIHDVLARIIIIREGKISLLTVLKLFFKELKDNSISSEANAVAFNYTLSLFPAIIFLFTMIPFIPVDNLNAEVFDFIRSVAPDYIAKAVEPTVSSIVNEKKTGLLTFGFITAMILSSNGMVGLMEAFNKCYRTREKRKFFRKRMVALSLTLLLTSVLFAAMVVLIFGRILLDFMGWEEYKFFRWIIEFLAYIFLFQVAFSMIYRYAPVIHKRWNFFSLGSIVATILAVTASGLFGLYLSKFATYNKVYGSLGVLIALMIWIQVISIVTLVGFELNASVDALKNKRTGKGSDIFSKDLLK